MVRNLVPARHGFVARLLVVVAVALAVRVGYVLVVERGDPLPGDGFYYHQAALLLADGEGFIDPARFVYGGAQESVFFGEENSTETAATRLPPGHREPTAGHPPAWTLVLGAASLVGLRSMLTHQLIGAVVGSLGVAAVALAAREIRRGYAFDPGADDRTGLIAGAIAAVYACLWLNDAMVMSESLVVGVVAVTVYYAVRFLAAPSPRRAVAFGVAAAVATLTRAELVLYLPVVLAIWLFHERRNVRAALRCSGLCVLTAVVVTAPWVVRNLTAFDEPVLLSNGAGTVLVQANCDATYSGEKLGYWELLCGLPQPLGPNGEPLDEAARDVVLRQRGLDYIAAHKRRLLTVVVPARIGRMWGAFDPIQQLRFDVLVQGRNFRLSMLGLIQFYALAPAAMAGALILRRRGAALVTLGVLPLVTTITAATAFGETRYRVASEVAVVILAACAVDAWTATRRTRAVGAVGGA